MNRIANGLLRRLRRWTGVEPLRIDAHHYVAEIAPMQLPPTSELRRIPPRPPEHRQPDYMANYDALSVFYDVFRVSGQVVFVGPTLANLEQQVLPALRFDGRPPASEPHIHRFNRTQITSFAIPSRPRRVSLDIEAARMAARILPHHHDTFAGRRVLYTLSKNNDLAWIEDWIEFYVRAHGVNAVLFYDNNSDRYGPADLLRRISAVGGIETAVVVPWPFAFGPLHDATRTFWDSDYCQYSMLEHARRRFLARAESIVQVDIDELLIAPNGANALDLLQQSPTGALLFPGRWIQSVAAQSGVPVRHRQFHHYVDDGNVAATKWVASPARIPDHIQMLVHGFGEGFEPTVIPGMLHRHFNAISTNWKYRRTDPIPFDPTLHRIDEDWIAQMRRIGWYED